MDNRELLELAAHAIGTELDWFEIPEGDQDGIAGWYCIKADTLRLWDPLNNDADAFRLTVDLAIYPTQEGGAAKVFLHRPPAINSWSCEDPYNGDPYAATRRAIVRAAAAIGAANDKP